MAEEFLNVPDIHAAFEQVAGASVPQHMRMNVVGKLCSSGRGIENRAHGVDIDCPWKPGGSWFDWVFGEIPAQGFLGHLPSLVAAKPYAAGDSLALRPGLVPTPAPYPILSPANPAQLDLRFCRKYDAFNASIQIFREEIGCALGQQHNALFIALAEYDRRTLAKIQAFSAESGNL